MADNVLGLLFEISADPTKAQEAISRFEGSTQTSLKNAAQGFQQTKEGAQQLDEGLLNATQSTRLLASELGIHLPRQVSSAIAQIMPSIAGLGTALVGAFVVKGVVDFGKELVALGHKLDGAADAANRLAEAGKENYKILEDTAKKSAEYAYSQIQLVRIQVRNLEAERDHLQRIYDNETKILGWFGKKGEDWIGDTERLNAKNKELADAQKLLNDLVRIYGEDKQEAHDKAIKAAARETEAQKRQLEEVSRFRQTMIRGMQEAGKVAAEEQKALDNETAAMIRMAKAEMDFTLRLEQYGIVEQRQVQGLRQLVPAMNEAATATVHLSNARKELIWITQTAREAQEQWVDSVQAEIAAVEGDLVGSIQSLTLGVAELIAGRKAAAGVEAVWETARGVADLAEGSWPPNPAAILAAGIHFTAAAEYAKIAGTSGGGSYHAGYGGAGSSAGIYGLRPGPAAPGATGTATRMTPPVTLMGSPTISGNVRIVVLPDSSAGQEVARVLNHYVTRQGGRLIASRAVLPPKAGR